MLLPVQVTFRNIEKRAGLEELVQEEAAKLERFFDRITSCRVVVERPQRAPSGKLYHVRIDLGLPGGELVVTHTPSLHGNQQDLKLQRTRTEADSLLVHKVPATAIQDAFREAKRRLQDYRRKQEGAVKTLDKTPEGTVERIFPGDGYGFIQASDGREVYFNQASVTGGRFDRLRSGARVRFVEQPGEKGPQASTVTIVRAKNQTRAAAGVCAVPRRTAGKGAGR